MNKQTGLEVNRYTSDAPVAWNGLGFDEFDHVDTINDPPIQEEGVVTDTPVLSYRWTKLQFRRKFTDAEKLLIDKFNTNFEVYDWLSAEQKDSIRTGLADYDVAEEIISTDPGVTAMLDMYTALGLIAPGRKAEILA